MSNIKISSSILAANCSTHKFLRKAVDIAEKGEADYLHIDVMDGFFVENKTIWNKPENISSINTTLPLDVHIMVKDPDIRYLEFVHAGASRLTFHIEASLHPEITMTKLHKWGVKVGLAISPETDIDLIAPYLEVVDYCLVMSVHPGKSGQIFMPEVIKKVDFIKKHSPHLEIQIDGGINLENAKLVIERGVSNLVIGSSIYNSNNPVETLKKFRNL